MNSRHILIGAVTCLLFLFANCDTMDDVKKLEGETNNLTLISLGGVALSFPRSARSAHCRYRLAAAAAIFL